MKLDMHYYGTYAIARASGIPSNDAETIAYAAQFVDDSTQNDSEQHSDGGLLYGIATAHTNSQVLVNNLVEPEEQRRVWVPFHFIPGGEGSSLEEKLLCVKDSDIAREMMEHHIETAERKFFRMELLGIACHVYMDTFAHYGFSGIGSEYNNVIQDTIQYDVVNKELNNYIDVKGRKFKDTYLTRSIAGFFAEKGSGYLGHGGGLTYPDRPYLKWQFEFEKERPNHGKTSIRDNPATYLEGCEKLHAYLSKFAQNFYADDSTIRPFNQISEPIGRILEFEGEKEKRIEQWQKAMKNNEIFETTENEEFPEYNSDDWENEKTRMNELASSHLVIDKPVYRFHQAAAFHRYYVLKDLLPKYGIAIY